MREIVGIADQQPLLFRETHILLCGFESFDTCELIIELASDTGAFRRRPMTDIAILAAESAYHGKNQKLPRARIRIAPVEAREDKARAFEEARCELRRMRERTPHLRYAHRCLFGPRTRQGLEPR